MSSKITSRASHSAFLTVYTMDPPSKITCIWFKARKPFWNLVFKHASPPFWNRWIKRIETAPYANSSLMSKSGVPVRSGRFMDHWLTAEPSTNRNTEVPASVIWMSSLGSLGTLSSIQVFVHISIKEPQKPTALRFLVVGLVKIALDRLGGQTPSSRVKPFGISWRKPLGNSPLNVPSEHRRPCTSWLMRNTSPCKVKISKRRWSNVR